MTAPSRSVAASRPPDPADEPLAAASRTGRSSDLGGAGAATVVAVVAHARAVSSTDRESFASALASLEPDEGALVVHTCHRVELYLTRTTAGDRPLPPLPAGTVVLRDLDAVRHLIEVACGLDSAVIGEDQILHQVRETLAGRDAAQPLDPVLDRLFQVGLHAGRQAHTWFNGSPRSLADVALDRLEEPPGTLHGRSIMVVGAGRMGRLAAFAAARRGARVEITNRTGSRAEELARDIGGTVVPWGSMSGSSAHHGVVLAVTGAWEVEPEAVAALLDGRAKVIDLSSPPALDAGLRRSLVERYVSVDELADRPGATLPDRLRRRLDRLVSETGRDFCRWLRSRESAPAIQAMAASAEERRQAEMTWLAHRLPDLSLEERAIVEQMSHRLVAGLLHAPMAALNADADGDLERAARELFRL